MSVKSESYGESGSHLFEVLAGMFTYALSTCSYDFRSFTANNSKALKWL